MPAVAYDLKSMGFSHRRPREQPQPGLGTRGHARDRASGSTTPTSPTPAPATRTAWRARPRTSKARWAASGSCRSPRRSGRPASRCRPRPTAPGRPGLSALRVQETVAAPKSAVEALAKAQCALYGKHCDDAPTEGSLFGTSYRAGRPPLERVHDGSRRPRRDLRRRPGRPAQCRLRDRRDPRARMLARLRRRQRAARRGEFPQGTGARRDRLRRGHVRDHGQPQSRPDGDLRLARTRQAADLLRARQLLLERRAGTAAGRPVRQEPRAARQDTGRIRSARPSTT